MSWFYWLKCGLTVDQLVHLDLQNRNAYVKKLHDEIYLLVHISIYLLTEYIVNKMNDFHTNRTVA